MDQPPPLKSKRHSPFRRVTRVSAKGLAVIRILCAILLAINLWLIYRLCFSSQGFVSFSQHHEQVSDVNKKIETLQAENEELYSRIQDFKTDAKFQERVVREQLGWARDNELVIEFQPSQKTSP